MMDPKTYGILWGFIITLVCGFILFIPMACLGLVFFPVERPDGHQVMAIGAWLFSMFFTPIVSIITGIYWGRKLYKRRLAK